MPRHKFNLADSGFAFTTRRPVAILMVVLAVAVFGWVSYNRLALTLMPDMSYPSLTVRTEYAGSAPEEVETTISQRLEQELGIVAGLTSISSISKAGQSDVILEFGWETDMNVVASDIREKVDRVRLPEDAERPILLRYDPTLDPILRLGLAGPQSLYELRYISEYGIKRHLESLDGVAAVKVKGGLEELYLVAIDESRLSTLALDINQINQRLAQGNVNMPGGNLREGQTEYLIRTMNEFESLIEIEDLIVARQGGVDIRLRDIGTVSRYHKDREVITAVNGRESIELEIYKEADANIVEVARRVTDSIYGTEEQQAYVAKLPPGATGPPEPEVDPNKVEPPTREGRGEGGGRERGGRRQRGGGGGGGASGRGDSFGEARRAEAARVAEYLQMTDFVAYQLPANADIQTLADQSIFIRNSINEVKNNAIFGAIIAVIVLFVFLRNLVQTLIIGVCIPISIIATFAPMFISDVSLNIISLGGLALGVGMLVDNAIVVLESIFRCREEGDELSTAVVRGVSEVGMAVIASTATTVAVFFPIVFVEGVAGQVFGDMALTVVFSLLASLLAALFFIPMLASRDFTNRGNPLAGELADRAFLQFPRADSGSSWFIHAGNVGTSLALLLLRSLRALLILTVGLLKIVGAIIGLVLLPMLRLVKQFGSIAAFFNSDRHGPLEGAHVWPGLLQATVLDNFNSSINNFCRWSQDGINLLAKIIRWISAPVALTFLLLRFVFAAVMRVISITLQTAAIILVATILVLARAITTLVAPLILPVVAGINHLFNLLQTAYPPVLRAALKNRWTVMIAAIAAFSVSWFFLLPKLGQELIPQVRQGEFNLSISPYPSAPRSSAPTRSAIFWKKPSWPIPQWLWSHSPRVRRTTPPAFPRPANIPPALPCGLTLILAPPPRMPPSIGFAIDSATFPS